MRKQLYSLLFICILSNSSLFSQEAPKNYYWGFSGSANFLVNPTVNWQLFDSEEKYDLGFGASVFSGYRFAKCWRIEAEGGYRKNKLKETRVKNSATVTVGEGKMESMHLLFNLLLDWKLSSSFTPYAGLGLGYCRVDYRNTSLGYPSVRSASDSAASQIILGLNYELTECLSLFCDLRYFSCIDPKLNDQTGSRVEAEYCNQTISMGLRHSW